MLAEVINNPLCVTGSNKPGSVRFVGEYDERHVLIAPVKVNQHEMWLESLYIRNKKDLERDIEYFGVVYWRG